MGTRIARLTAAVICLALFLAAAVARAQVDADVLAAENQRAMVSERAAAAAVAVFMPGGQGGGSGVVISPDGYALSNFHVTGPAGAAMQCGMADGRLYDAVIVGLDPTGDVALIKLVGREDFPFAELADSDQVRVGDWAFSVGNPFLLATDFFPSVSWGIVSGVHRYQYPAGTLLEYADCIQVDCAINPGNSGGPLFDAQGRVIGINGRGSFEKRGRVNVGVGYAISSNQIKHFLGQLKSGRIVDHATLGALVATSTDGRVVVSDILETCDAFRRGLRYGDEIISFAGRPIHSANALKNAVGIFPKGWRVPLTFRRRGALHDVWVRLAGVHRTGELEQLVQKGDKPDGEPDEEIPEGEKPKERPEGDKPRQEEPPKDGAPPKEDGPPKKDGPPKEEGPPKGEGPKPDGPQPGRRPGRPGTQPHERRPLPESLKMLFEARPGYANYHFNRLEQQRLWKAISSRGIAGENARWTVTAQIQGGGQVVITIDDAGCSIKTPTGDAEFKAGDDLAVDLAPAGSGGLFATLYLWRRLMTGGIEKFGQLYYLGTLPLAGREAPVDVLVGVHGGVECRFYVNGADGELLVVEMNPDEELDPCELWLSEPTEFKGRVFPQRLSVRNGDQLYAEFLVKELDIPAKEAP